MNQMTIDVNDIIPILFMDNMGIPDFLKNCFRHQNYYFRIDIINFLPKPKFASNFLILQLKALYLLNLF